MAQVTRPPRKTRVITATKVDSTLLELAAISVRYCFAQCLACSGLGARGETVDILGASLSARTRLFRSDIVGFVFCGAWESSGKTKMLKTIAIETSSTTTPSSQVSAMCGERKKEGWGSDDVKGSFGRIG